MEIPPKKVPHTRLGGGFQYFLCSSLFGEMIQFDVHMFQMGWFNHQLVDLQYLLMFGSTMAPRGGEDSLYFSLGTSDSQVIEMLLRDSWNMYQTRVPLG